MILIPKKDKDALNILLQKFLENGFQIFLVGGALRDLLMEKTPHDYDLTTDATPQDMLKIFPRALKTGIKHGTLTIRVKGKSFEVTTMRLEGTYTDGRHPDSITFGHDINEDLGRRDFSINAIAMNLIDKKIIDPFNGTAAIKNKMIKAVGNAKKRFLEDGLRPVRALRFMVQLDFSLDEETKNAIFNPVVRDKIKAVSAERFHDELIKILSTRDPLPALKVLKEAKIYEIFFPAQIEDKDLSITEGVKAYASPLLNLSALLFEKEDIEKYCRAIKMSCDGTKYIKKIIDCVKCASKWEEFDKKVIRPQVVRKFLSLTGEKDYSNAIALWEAVEFANNKDCNKSINKNIGDNFFDTLRAMCKSECENGNCFSIARLAVNGNDLIKIGIRGKDIGATLKRLLDAIIADPALNKKERLLDLLKNESQA